MANYTRENKRQYAQAQGYTFIDASTDKDLGRLLKQPDVVNNIMAGKFFIVNYYMSQRDTNGDLRWEYVLWSDADSMFLNHSRSFVDAGMLDPDVDMVLASGHPMDWWWGQVVNMGHFFMRNSVWSRKFLRHAWSLVADPDAKKRKCPPNLYGHINFWLDLCSDHEWGPSFWLGDQVHAEV